MSSTDCENLLSLLSREELRGSARDHDERTKNKGSVNYKSRAQSSEERGKCLVIEMFNFFCSGCSHPGMKN